MDFIEIISNVGFPIAVATYFMLRFEKILEKNTSAIESLKRLITIKLK